MIRTIRPLDRPDPGLERAAKANGFSLHARVSCEDIKTRVRSRKSARTLLKNAWHGQLHAIVQK